MEEIRIINQSHFLGKEIDVWGSAAKPFFKAADVANWIGLTSVSDMVKRIDREELTKFNLGSRQGETWFLTEDGLYEILMQSRKPAAKQFKKGVKTILHEIRTKGGYIVAQQTDTPEMIMARALKVADETIKRNEERLKALEAENQQQATAIEMQGETIALQKKEIAVSAPKVQYYEDTLASTDCITTTQVADDLGISAMSLNKKLEELGIQYYQSKSWHLMGRYRSWRLASTRTHNYTKSDGSTGTRVTLVWNQRGKRLILALYKNNFNMREAIADINGSKTAQATTSSNI